LLGNAQVSSATVCKFTDGDDLLGGEFPRCAALLGLVSHVVVMITEEQVSRVHAEPDIAFVQDVLAVRD
jgi:hypothetical protein